jgi:Domain of unknown function (DUF4340)
MNRNLTIGLVVVFAALALYVLLVQRPRDLAGEATATSPTTSYLWSITADQITGLRVVDLANEREVGLAKDASGAWALTAPEPQPADQSAASTAVSGLTMLAVSGELTTVTDLAAFGVLSPTYTVEVSLADGGRLRADVGDKAPTGASYYVLREGESTVVAVTAFNLDSLIGLLDNPPVVVPTPTPLPLVPETPGTPSTPAGVSTTQASPTATARATAPAAASPTP